MNQVKLIGRLTRDAELNERSETKVCDMRVAVNGSGKAPTLFIDVVAFGDLAENGAELRKGSEVEVSGALRYSEWEAKPKGKSKTSEKRSKHSVIARELVARTWGENAAQAWFTDQPLAVIEDRPLGPARRP